MRTEPSPAQRPSTDPVPSSHRRAGTPAGRRPRGLRIVALTATMLCGAAGVVVAGQAFAAEGPRRGGPGRGGPGRGGPGSIQPGSVQRGPGSGPLRPPGDVRPVGTFRVATGVQIYTCTGGTFSAPSTPEATLVAGNRSLHHFGGPSWQSNADGSLVTASKTAESPVAGAIPELLLTVKTHSGDPAGELAAVTYIQRLRTSGGVAPTGPCTGDVKAPVPYSATYVFFAPR